jgi:hypothetical protein
MNRTIEGVIVSRNRAERRHRGKQRLKQRQEAIQALMRHLDTMNADPRPWRIHEPEGGGSKSSTTTP